MVSIFPKIVSLTITDACNLRCKMCGQWKSRHNKRDIQRKDALTLDIWRKVIDEIARHKGTILLIRGGEPFLHPSIIDLLALIKKKNIFVSIDTNGMFLEKYSDDIVRLGIDNLVISVDGPEKIHDYVRGFANSFAKIKSGLEALRLAEKKHHISIPKILCFVISPYSYRGLDKMPDVARQLKLKRISIVPYYYFNQNTGLKYERIMRKEFGCSGSSWRGFQRESSGINKKELIVLLRNFKKNLKGIINVPFMNLSESEYEAWFADCFNEAKQHTCRNPWLLADIQPNGDVNFCVDFYDYAIGNVNYNTLKQIWNGKRAKKFRDYLQRKSLPVCLRCGAQYISG